MKNWFITGVSRGFGKALARQALERGDRVVGTARDGVSPFGESHERFRVLALDLLEDDGPRAVVEEAVAWAGRLDVVVNNSGYGLLGPIETATDEEIGRLFQINVFGAARVIQAALPHMRAQGSGHVVNITSIAGRAPNAGSGFYGATKFAMEGLSASLAQEVKAFGIRVTAVAPGAFRTDFLSAHSIRRNAVSDAYAETTGAAVARLDDMSGKQIGDPEKAAAAILKVVDAGEPPLHLLLGSDAYRRMGVKMESMAAEMKAWEAVSVGTDFDDA